jgi:hypothetical protein
MNSEEARIGLPNCGEGDPLYPYVDPDEFLAALVSLFASDPHLAEQLLNLSAGYEAGKNFPLFDCLFVEATGSALSAEDHVFGYRLRNAEERNLAFRAFDRNQISQSDHDATLHSEV